MLLVLGGVAKGVIVGASSIIEGTGDGWEGVISKEVVPTEKVMLLLGLRDCTLKVKNPVVSVFSLAIAMSNALENAIILE